MRKRRIGRYIFRTSAVVAACALVAIVVFVVFSVVLGVRWKNFHQDISGTFTASYDGGSYATYEGQEVPLNNRTINFFFTYLISNGTVPYGVGGNPNGEQIVLHLSAGATLTLTRMDNDGGVHVRWRDSQDSTGFYIRSQITYRQLCNAIENCMNYDQSQ